MSKPTYTWHCLRCGKCCTYTVNETVFGKAGVFLMPEERKLFPDPIVKPLYAVGRRGNARPRPQIIYAYQMIGTPCPHWNNEEKICRIYDYRPLACRQFPLSGTLGSVVLHRECPSISSLIPENAKVKSQQLKGFDIELKALRSIATYFNLIYIFNIHKVDTRYAWFYNFDKAQWFIPSNEQLLEALGKAREKMRRLDR